MVVTPDDASAAAGGAALVHRSDPIKLPNKYFIIFSFLNSTSPYFYLLAAVRIALSAHAAPGAAGSARREEKLKLFLSDGKRNHNNARYFLLPGD